MAVDHSQPPQRRGRHRRPVIIGLTGPIAAGKSTVADYLRERGAEIIDADHVYRSLLAPGSNLSRRIVDRFGREVVAANGGIDRAALGDLVFRDTTALADLDRITHPAIVAEIRELIDQSPASVVVIEAVKLAQSGLASDVDSLWFVTANEEARLKRLAARPGMDEAKAKARVAAAPQSVPEGVRVDFVFDNSGELSATRRAVDEAWQTVISTVTKERRQPTATPLEESS